MYIGKELLNPKNDYVFKRIFGHKGNEEITKQMLSSIMKREIKNITLSENTILEKDLQGDKIGIVDIHAKIEEETEVDIEMQVIDEKNIEKRIMYYWSLLYTKGIQQGAPFYKLHKTIGILIADFKIENLRKIEKYCTKWQIREEEHTSVILTDILELYIIELPKARENKKKDKETMPWIKFLENPKEMEMEEMSEENKVAIKKAKEVLEEISEDEHERYIAYLRDKAIRDEKSIEAYGYDKGLEEGAKKGKEDRTQEIVKEMLKQSISIDVIVLVTGLSKEEVEKLK